MFHETLYILGAGRTPTKKPLEVGEFINVFMRPRFLVRQAESSEMLLHVLEVQTHSSLPFLCLEKDEPLAALSLQNSVTLFQIFSLRARCLVHFVEMVKTIY